ncbi:AraC family transcriptional regulator, partial [Streptomyces sp. SCA2-4]|nr:AraC family transcriptional regulator [Streptomyces huiliensis]
MHTVAVLVLPRVIPFDLSTAVETFGRVRLSDGSPGYAVRVCAERPGTDVDAGVFTLRAPWGLDGLCGADTVVVPGTADPAAPLAPGVRTALRRAAAG